MSFVSTARIAIGLEAIAVGWRGSGPKFGGKTGKPDRLDTATRRGRLSGAPIRPDLAREPLRIRTKPRRQTIPWFCRPPSPTGRAAPSPHPTPCATPRARPPRFLAQRRQRARRGSSPARRPLPLCLRSRYNLAGWANGRLICPSNSFLRGPRMTAEIIGREAARPMGGEGVQAIDTDHSD